MHFLLFILTQRLHSLKFKFWEEFNQNLYFLPLASSGHASIPCKNICNVTISPFDRAIWRSCMFVIWAPFFQLDLNSPYFGPSMTKCLSQMDSCHSRPSLNICLLIYSPGYQQSDSLIFPHLRYLPILRRLERGIYLRFPVCRNCSPWTFHLASCIMTIIIIIIIIIQDALKTTVFNGDFYRSSLS